MSKKTKKDKKAEKAYKLLQFEHALELGGFERKWFDDSSSYWFYRTLKFPIFGEIGIEVDPENKQMILEVKGMDGGTSAYASREYKVKNMEDVSEVLTEIVNYDLSQHAINAFEGAIVEHTEDEDGNHCVTVTLPNGVDGDCEVEKSDCETCENKCESTES